MCSNYNHKIYCVDVFKEFLLLLFVCRTSYQETKKHKDKTKKEKTKEPKRKECNWEL